MVESQKPIDSVLIANRGEIAVRIVRACKDLGIRSVVAFSEADRRSTAVSLANDAVCIGPAPPEASYLNVNAVVAAAIMKECDAIHPGYGFLAENPELPQSCEEYDLLFIGPRAETIRQLGNKIAARQIATEAGVPVISGPTLAGEDHEAAMAAAGDMGYPLLIKAAAGGGGRGLRRVDAQAELSPALTSAASEARSAFGDDTLYIEKFLADARHVEVQVAADREGKVVHLGERDCSLQRRYQKLVEESPSPGLSSELQERIYQYALKLVSSVDYEGVGTVEFLVNIARQEVFFLEVNTRIQVEHPVTELTSRIDIVALQMLLVTGAPLPFQQENVARVGHAIEFRINAEDVSAGFAPSAGTIQEWRPPEGPWVRTDTHCHAGYVVPPYYDSMLAKVIVYGNDRPEALARSQRALSEFCVAGIETNLPFHRWILSQDSFASGDISTNWVSANLQGELK